MRLNGAGLNLWRDQVPKKPKPTFKPPAKLGACADLLYTTRQERLGVHAPKVKECEEVERALREHFIATLPKSEAEGVSGRLARVQLKAEVIPIIEDRELLEKYIKRKRCPDLLNAPALNFPAVRERWDAGEVIPGVGTFSVIKVSVNKL